MAAEGGDNADVGVVVLDDILEDDFQPTTEEFHEYAQWLGMDLEEDEDLLWIAEMGLKAPLPPQWRPCQTADNEIFYHNFQTGESVWDHPCDDYHRKLYAREKRKKQPCLVGSLVISQLDAETVAVNLKSMAGNDLAVLTACNRRDTLQSIRKKFKKQLEHPLKLILPDGRLYSRVHAKSKIFDLLEPHEEQTHEEQAHLAEPGDASDPETPVREVSALSFRRHRDTQCVSVGS
eukprot:TRINITY_DN30498_c0_g1_i1.p1 TRINITY_DN30498_c0_g1~~TRINITY_DN30498_c0_g1_i1.p1  ORF type:complete len:234 (+),score=35.94 TRINITY_DN30498_c0_g1_i1:69-770(+)